MKRDYWKIENNEVMGYVRTDSVGSQCEFAICSLEEAEEMDDKEFEEYAKDALFESGLMEWGY